jgi:hypothetical protein
MRSLKIVLEQIVMPGSSYCVHVPAGKWLCFELLDASNAPANETYAGQSWVEIRCVNLTIVF